MINGFNATLGQFPWHAILKTHVDNRIMCGGSIIASNWVLTAAHCVDFPSMYVKVGTIILDDSLTPTDNDYSITMEVSDIYEHPDYNTDTYQNDIALLRLAEHLKFNRYIKPIPLVGSRYIKETFAGQTAISSGFGTTSDDSVEVSNILQWIYIQILDTSICVEKYSEKHFSESVICALNDDRIQATCMGDSGGALLVKDPSKNLLMQIGINSFVGQNACSRGRPSGHTRLTHFLPFISNITGMQL